MSTKKPKTPTYREQDDLHRGIMSGIAPAISNYMNGIAERARYLLIEMKPHPDIDDIEKAYFLSPSSLDHVTVNNSIVRLYTTGGYQLNITPEEWDRIKSKFGYQSPGTVTLSDLITMEKHPKIKEEDNQS